MAIYKVYDSIQQYLFGCQHNNYKILKVDVEVNVENNRLRPIYFVNADCKNCGDKCCHVLPNPHFNDPRTIKAATWLSDNGKSFMGRDKYEELLDSSLSAKKTSGE